MTQRRRMAAFLGVLLALLLAALDQTVVTTALPRIAADLHGFSDISWIVSAYLLTSTATVPLYGKLADVYGRRLLFVVAISLFVAGSVLCALASGMTELAAFRAVQGLGAGGLFPLALIAIGDLFSPRERGRYQAHISSVWALASIGGPLVGGVFTDHASWRWIFWINLPLGLLALAVVTTQMHVPQERHAHRLDYAGAAAVTAAISCLLLVATWGGTTYAWGSPQIVALSAAAVALLVVFARLERRASEPMLPLHLLRIRTVAFANAAVFLLGAAIFVFIVYVPLFAQGVLGDSATRSGIVLLPFNLLWVAASVVSGRAIARTGRYRVFPIIGTPLVLIGMLLVSRAHGAESSGALAAFAAVGGIGFGLTAQTYVVALQNAVAREELGVATASNQFCRSMGGALAVAAFGTLLVSRLGDELARRRVHGVDPAALLRSPTASQRLPHSVVEAVHASLAHALDSVFLFATPLAVLGIVAAVCLPELPLRTTSHVEMPLESDAAEAV